MSSSQQAILSQDLRESGRICITTAVLDESVMRRLGGKPAQRSTILAGDFAEAECLVTDPSIGADASMIAAMPRLQLIACYGVGVDTVDLQAAAQRSITVTNTPGLMADAVADLALALMLASARDIVVQDRYVRTRRWTTPAATVPVSRGLRDKTIGVLGLGAIGSAVAERASGFGMTVYYTGPREKPVPYRFVADLQALAAMSDFLVVAAPGGAATRHLVNSDVLRALGPAGTLVNVSRGTLVDESAMIALLQSGGLGFAALDVFETEPHIPDQLLALPNVVLTPHQGSATRETRLAMAQLVFANVEAFFQGRPYPTPVVIKPTPPRR